MVVERNDCHSDIIKALEKRHSNDFGLSEVKAGSSQMMHGVPRFDFWAMKKSWAKPDITGYEIKVSRSDFQGDDKWVNYLPYCNQLFWVTPWKMVLPEECPGNTGLMWLTKTGNRIIRKKKAEYRDVKAEDLELVFRYILMWRVQQRPENHDRGPLTRGERIEQWKKALEEDKEGLRVGDMVGKKVRVLVRRAQYQLDEVEIKEKHINEVENKLKKMGIELSSKSFFSWPDMIDRKALGDGVVDLRSKLRSIKQTCERLENEIKSVTTPHE